MKRKKYYLTVTQSAKKEMAEAEKAEQQRLDQRTKLEHAKAYRRQLSTKFRDFSIQYVPSPNAVTISWNFVDSSSTGRRGR